MGYYLTVFYEERYGGVKWGIRSFRFREIRKGEIQDAVTLVFWALFAVSSALFVAALSIYGERVFLNSLILLPLAFWMGYPEPQISSGSNADKWGLAAPHRSSLSRQAG